MTNKLKGIKTGKRNYIWLLLLLLFDLVFYLFIQLATSPTDAQGNRDIAIHWEAIAFGFFTSLVSLYTVHLVKGMLKASQGSILARYIRILVFSLFFYVLIVAAFMFGTEYLMGSQRNLGYILGNAIVLIFHHFIVGNAFIAYLYLKESNTLKEELIVTEKMKAELELKALQQQMSPHFLFNNLNTLTSLINPAEEDALTFTKSLASIYRYFTKNAGEDLVSLREELSFIEDYFELMTHRFGSAYRLEIETGTINPTKILLLPMSLQLVVENAIKHNSGDRQNPLLIHMQVTETQVIVKNEIRAKPQPSIETESGTGLKNLDERCRLVIGHGLRHFTKSDHFVVELPLIKQVNDESIDH